MGTDAQDAAFWGVLGAVLGVVVVKIAELGFDRWRAKTSKKLWVAGYDDVLEWGWDGIKLLRKLIELDKVVIRQGLNEEREGTAEQWGPVFMSHPETWALLVQGKNNIVGYWHFATLNKNAFARAKAGQLLDSEINMVNFSPIDLPGTYNLYFVLIGVRPEHAARAGRLIEVFFERLTQLAESGIYFQSICANAFTPEGVRTCKAFKLVWLRKHLDYGEIYHRDFLPFPNELRGLKSLAKLAELYDAVYAREQMQKK